MPCPGDRRLGQAIRFPTRPAPDWLTTPEMATSCPAEKVFGRMFSGERKFRRAQARKEKGVKKLMEKVKEKKIFFLQNTTNGEEKAEEIKSSYDWRK